MATYALLILPSANRVYAEASPALARDELEIFSQSVLGGSVREITETTIGGVPYLTFEATDIGNDAAAYLANLSVGFALFERKDGLLRPVELRRLDRYDDDLISRFTVEMIDDRLEVSEPDDQGSWLRHNSGFDLRVTVPTGTCCPSLPQKPLRKSRSLATASIAFSTSRLLPSSVMPLSGAVTLPSSIR